MSLQIGSQGLSCNACSNVQSNSKTSVISLGGKDIKPAQHTATGIYTEELLLELVAALV